MGENKQQHTFFNVFSRGMLGGVANVVAISIMSPLDVLKIRFQTQGELIKGATKDYPGIIGGAIKIVKDEGVRGLYKGLPISAIRELTFSSTRMGLYEPIRHMLTTSETPSLGIKVVAGLASGAIAAAIFNPTDIIKVRMQADRATTKQSQKYKSVANAFMTILRTEGLRDGLYKGVETTVLRAAALTSAQLASYDHSKHTLMNSFQFADNFSTHVCASIFAGLMTTLASNPLDVVRTRIFNEASKPKSERIYSNPITSLVRIGAAEGIAGLYKGFWPSYLRMGSATVIIFVLYEQLRRLVGIPGL